MGRIDKFKAKINGRITGEIYERLKKRSIELETTYFKRAEELETAIKKIISNESSLMTNYYIIYAKELDKAKKRHSSETLKSEAGILKTKWITRGLKEELMDIIDAYMNIFASYTPPGPPPPPPSPDLLEDLEAYYTLDSNYTDSLGNHNAQYQGGSIYGSGKINSCYYSPGNGEHLICGTINEFGIQESDFSIGMWIKLRSITIERRIFQSVPGGNNRFLLTSNAGSLSFKLETIGGDDIASINNFKSISTDTWYHVVITYKRGVGSKAYVNGVQEGETNSESVFTLSNNNIIFSNNSSISDMFGYWDEVFIYKKALTEEEILMSYNEGNGLQYPFE